MLGMFTRPSHFVFLKDNPIIMNRDEPRKQKQSDANLDAAANALMHAAREEPKARPREKEQLEIFAHAFRHCTNVFLSGFAVASVLAAFRLVSGKQIAAFAKWQDSLTSHIFNLPMSVLDMVFFVAGLTFAVSGPWGPLLRKRLVKPSLDFLLHSFGLAAGFVPVIWLLDSKSLLAASWFLNLVSALMTIILLSLFTFVISAGSFLCERGVKGILSDEELATIPAWVRTGGSFLSLPFGILLMWVAYQDLVQQSLKVTGH